MPDAERDTDADDCPGRAEDAGQARDAEAAEDQLLDHRRDQDDHGEVRSERARVARLPVVRHEPLVLAGVQHSAEQLAHHSNGDERGNDPTGRGA